MKYKSSTGVNLRVTSNGLSLTLILVNSLFCGYKMK